MLGNQQGCLVSHWKFLLVQRHVQAAHTGSKGWHVTAGRAGGFWLSCMHSPSLQAVHSICDCQVHVMWDRERHTGGSYARLVYAQSCWMNCSKAACVCPLYLLSDLPCSARCKMLCASSRYRQWCLHMGAYFVTVQQIVQCVGAIVSLCSTIQPKLAQPLAILV